jgi:glutamyl-tRNA synthetase
MSRPLARFAPSPTGNLHVGNLRTALVNYLFARSRGGDFMLRIDDTDAERSTPEFEESIRKDLVWMGMEWDREDRQSSRINRYGEILDQLLKSGRAYKCFETPEELGLKRKAQLAAGRPPVYDRAALNLTTDEIAALESAGEKPHYRFKLDDVIVTWTDLVRGEVSVPMSSLSDPVILRADGRVIYTLASVVDDLDHGVTHVLRGEDHTTNSAAQIQLFEALGGTSPEMGHFALLAGADGEGLSKRLGSHSVDDLRQNGVEAMAIASLLARIGTSDPVEACSDMSVLVEGFDISRFGRATAKFDPTELNLLNGRILGMMEYDAVSERLADMGIDMGADFWVAIRGNLNTIDEVKTLHDMIMAPIMPVVADEDKEMLATAAQLLPDGDPDAKTWERWTKAVAAETGRKGKELFMPLRLALTGQPSGPELAELLPLMGRERIITRVRGETG